MLAFGAGYRAYFAFDGERIIVILIRAYKSSQSRAIEKAKELWEGYRQA